MVLDVAFDPVEYDRKEFREGRNSRCVLRQLLNCILRDIERFLDLSGAEFAFDVPDQEDERDDALKDVH